MSVHHGVCWDSDGNRPTKERWMVVRFDSTEDVVGTVVGRYLTRGDANEAAERLNGVRRVCALCLAHYGDNGQCDEGKPIASPHRKAAGAQ